MASIAPQSVMDKIIYCRHVMIAQNGAPPTNIQLGRNQWNELKSWATNVSEKKYANMSEIFGIPVEKVDADDFFLIYKAD